MDQGNDVTDLQGVGFANGVAALYCDSLSSNGASDEEPFEEDGCLKFRRASYSSVVSLLSVGLLSHVPPFLGSFGCVLAIGFSSFTMALYGIEMSTGTVSAADELDTFRGCLRGSLRFDGALDSPSSSEKSTHSSFGFGSLTLIRRLGTVCFAVSNLSFWIAGS
jgi:hypothetical protein